MRRRSWRDPTMRTLLTVLGAAVLLTVAHPASAQQSCPEVRVVEVSGLLDPVLVDFVERPVVEAAACGAVAVVLQLDSPGAVVDDDRLDDLVAAIEGADVPITVWVGPAGAQARNGAAELVAAADVAALA